MTLSIQNISKRYGDNLALDRFSAELTPGIYALLGPNGAGKSTLMNILTDNLKADSGVITLDGENILSMGERYRAQLGFMPQYPGLYPNFTVERFMWYMAALKGLSRERAARDIPEILRAVELDDVPRRKIGALSGGMKQRLSLAQAVLGDPSILILDEPTAGLDPKQRIAIRNYISRIALDKIVLIATHVVSDVEFIAREIIMLRRGVIADRAAAHELTARIEGKVWHLPVAPERVAELQACHRVTAIARDESGTGGQRVILRVLCEDRPAENATAVASTLEDYYLYLFGEHTAE